VEAARKKAQEQKQLEKEVFSDKQRQEMEKEKREMRKTSKSAVRAQPVGDDRDRRISRYVEDRKKSTGVALVLTFLFGPIGLLYANILYGVILTIIAIVGATTIFIPLIVWVFSIIDAPFAVKSYNKKMRSEAELLAG
jgi:hypothetical protein